MYSDDDVVQHGAHVLVNLHVRMRMQLQPLQFDIEDISWSIDSCQSKASADQYHMNISQAQVLNSSRLHVLFFLSWLLTRLKNFIWSQARVFSQIIRTSQKFGTLLLGLAKAIYMYYLCTGIHYTLVKEKKKTGVGFWAFSFQFVFVFCFFIFFFQFVGSLDVCFNHCFGASVFHGLAMPLFHYNFPPRWGKSLLIL